ncbi:phosphate ABC transporter substrate-binding protein PstS family protein [Latilactobacillus sakei]|uniref:Phosphate-binding protein n=1 Tax=Latilactobacillus sakei TaxID=1599 RepID=A0AAX0VDE2_LATSK|nr:phosphate ABC transporter substrate-binding protein PstS family protein [Latilactobacillus sakei]ASN12161.1 phosphate ABC transporter substrate-binding protein [Latilactobacillus sakei]MCM1635874.1 phosphate ABC transporter substrate-binding protein PstS family protein [Latilactobacillus sakei]PKX61138.1 phosphate ABC transporter substrate-binding protein [Latilactobacillus sakei]PKX70063.1 phosphate ABC transporter substrate-binding protein [Latilactobacillus sakei]PKX71277.1 phosphate ABC
MRKRSVIGLLVTFVVLLLTGCQSKQNGQSVTAVGSSALQPLIEALAEQYSAQHSGQFINVQGGGSGTGLSQIQEGAVQMGNSDLFAEEKAGIKAGKLVDHKVAVVGITPVINKKIGVKNLSLTQLAKIFSGEITNWQQVGGPDQEVVLVNRAQGSGTRSTFEQWVMGNRKTKPAQEQDSTGMVRSIVANTPGAISYLAFSYVDNTVATLKLDGVAPDDQNVMNNTWPIWSYEHVYTKGQPTGLTKEFLAYVLSDKIQNKQVIKMGYIPVAQMQVERSLDGTITKVK